MTDEENNCCEDCVSLGQSSPTSLNSPCFFTLSPDPDRDGYREMLPLRQAKYIVVRINNVFKSLKLSKYSIHFELNTAGDVHVHGIVWLSPGSTGYDLPLINLSKPMAAAIGRKRVPSKVSSRFEWPKDLLQTLCYLNKSNIFKPLHINSKVANITNYLITEAGSSGVNPSGETFS